MNLSTCIDLEVDTTQQSAINDLLKQRIESRKPVAYLTGTAWFAGMPFHTAEGVIVPRSHIGGFLLENGRPWIKPGSVKRILDLCTGSGCIAVAAAMAFPEAGVDATDIDPLALALAEKNIKEYKMENRIQLIESDIYQNLSAVYDLILANPPYVPGGEIPHFPAEYQHEPTTAFDGGPDGLDLVHIILNDASRFLAPEGQIVVEVGESWTTLEQAYPKVAFNWLETGVEDSGLFIMDRQELEQYF
jgi:ribosomal protein L3 glutamine methyltransferase